MTAHVTRVSEPSTVRPRELLELFGDERACEILCHLDTESLTAAELVERCDISRPTAYRRLDELTDAGIVDSQCRTGDDGRERREFSLALEAVEFEIRGDDVDGSVRHTDTAGD